MEPIAFRLASTTDVARIVPLVESAYRGDSSRAGWTTEADLLDGQRTDAQAVIDIIEDAASDVLLAELGDDLVGCAKTVSTPGDTLYFGMFAVDPARQGQGIGRALITEAEIRAQAAGVTQVKMTVIRQRKDLIAWYERLGYQATGEFEPFPYGDERFGLPKRDDLEFAVLVKRL